MDTTITPIENADLAKITLVERDELCEFSKVINVPCIDIIKSVDGYLLCSNLNCSKKLLQASATAIVRCDKCGSRMRVGSCARQLCVHVVVTPSTGGDPIELTMFQKVLCEVIGNALSMGDDEISQCLLALEKITITYDATQNVITKMSVL